MISTQVITKSSQKCDYMLEKWLVTSHQFGYEVRRMIDQNHEIMLRELETKAFFKRDRTLFRAQLVKRAQVQPSVELNSSEVSCIRTWRGYYG